MIMFSLEEAVRPMPEMRALIGRYGHPVKWAWNTARVEQFVLITDYIMALANEEISP